ncbi:unnamed protein product [Prorocentrum cordatum]|uniref:Uncharacterized protein n=1 Tax=Prorocentrum cordatum TaxID=2364126 RepID=A0ABN9XH58_9DINO|nr:unnamed protein product [Polarella glacialis]
MQALIGEVAQDGIGSPVRMKVKIGAPAKRRKPKEPHFEDGDKENIENLKESHDRRGKQHELGGVVAMAEGVLQDSKRQDKFNGGGKDKIEDGVKVLVGGAATFCEEREAKRKEQEGTVKHCTMFKGSGDSTALADVVPLGRTVLRAAALPLARARPSAAEAAAAQARLPSRQVEGSEQKAAVGSDGLGEPLRAPTPLMAEGATLRGHAARGGVLGRGRGRAAGTGAAPGGVAALLCCCGCGGDPA